MKYDLESTYTSNFFEDNLIDSFPVAKYMAPLIAKKLQAKTVVDLGCASGHWLSAFQKEGLTIFGVEGSKNSKSSLVIPEKYVLYEDLRNVLQVEIKKQVDLLLSIEVAEHLEPMYADNYVHNLTQVFKPKYIIMTAAPVGQGGHGHYNEQPKSYWIQKIEKVGYNFNPQLKDYLTIKIIEGRNWSDAPEELKVPIASWANNSLVRGYSGVWIPHWLPDNLLCFERVEQK